MHTNELLIYKSAKKGEPTLCLLGDYKKCTIVFIALVINRLVNLGCLLELSKNRNQVFVFIQFQFFSEAVTSYFNTI